MYITWNIQVIDILPDYIYGLTVTYTQLGAGFIYYSILGMSDKWSIIQNKPLSYKYSGQS